ncbi:hypothetical protein C8R47DRAFT_1228815 [Mycena vitilis]|nr:hypothetical protein C8R47DRAFT_1228815 [Mycena vitilis]
MAATTSAMLIYRTFDGGRYPSCIPSSCFPWPERRVEAGSRLKNVTHLRARQTQPVHLELNIEEYRLPVAKLGWMGVRQAEVEGREFDLEALIAFDPEMRVYEWHGEPTPVLDKTPPRRSTPSRNGGASLLPMPQTPLVVAHMPPNMWGRPWAAGRNFPQNLLHSAVNTAVFAGLFGEKCIQRIAGWTNVLFMAFAPDLHEYYRTTLDDLCSWVATQTRVRKLVRNFAQTTSVFSTATFNFGPRTITLPHIDFGAPSPLSAGSIPTAAATSYYGI